MAKPAGPACNLACTYCFYLEKQGMFPGGTRFRMAPDVLETFTREYIASQDTPEVNFAWQGGEPTLLGVDFFKQAVALQQKYANGKRITNAMQTNGVLLDDAWCAFLRDHNFLIGISIDGPQDLHDRYRVDHAGHGSYARCVQSIERMRRHKVEFNSLTVVNAANAAHPQRVYRCLKELGVQFMQFIPLVERLPGARDARAGLSLAAPPRLRATHEARDVPDYCVGPTAFGSFLCAIFDEWVRRDVGQTYVQQFDVTLGNVVGAGPGLCVCAKYCGNAMIIEHNGDVYSCDHFMYPEYRLGNVMTDKLRAMADADFQQQFGRDKFDALPAECRACAYLRLCHGGCPKHRFLTTAAGQGGLNYLCAGYQKFYAHTAPYMRIMADLLARQQAPAHIMEMLRAQERAPAPGTPARNAPCPCGSGKKYKLCCGATPPTATP
jgi:uncharacterized protein